MSERTYGAPIPKEMVRALRERAGLSQEALANRLGLAGKAVVSGWETGRTSCEGPAAELLVQLFATDTSRSFTEISSIADATWRRAGTWVDTWRQISAVPEVAVAIERDVFSHLFPVLASSSDLAVDGFPFVDRGAGTNVFGIGQAGWSGSIPPERDRAPRYLWQLDRNGSFVYREVVWEELRDSNTLGHTHVGSLLELAASTAAFVHRLMAATRLDRDTRYVLRFDLENMHGRGIASANGDSESTDLPTMLSNEKHLFAMISCSLGEISDSTLQISYSLVAELLSLIRPDLATADQLDRQLQLWRARDRKR